MTLKLNVAKPKDLSGLGANQLKSRQQKTEANFAAPKMDFRRQLELRQAAKKPRDLSPSATAGSKAEVNKNQDTQRERVQLNREDLKPMEEARVSEDIEREALKAEVEEKSTLDQANLKSENIEDETLEAEVAEKEGEETELLEALNSLIALLNQEGLKTEDLELNPEMREGLEKIEALLENKLVASGPIEADQGPAPLTAERTEDFLRELESLLAEAGSETEGEIKAEAESKMNEGLGALKEILEELRAYQTELRTTRTEAQKPQGEEQPGLNTEEGEDGLKSEDLEFGAVKARNANERPDQSVRVKPSREVESTNTEGNQALKLGTENRVNEVGQFALKAADLAEINENTQIQQTKLSPAMKMDVFEQVRSFILREGAGIDERSEMVIRLKPEELGRLELKIELHNDEVSAKFQVASQSVKEALEANLEDLKMALKDKGFEVENLSIDVRDGSKEGGRSDREPTRRPKSYFKIEAGEEAISLVYQKSLEATVAESTFEHLA